MEAGSYQVGPLCLCLYIIWSSWSLQLLHMIWYSGAHWSMADCTISSFFTLPHIPTFELLKLDLRTWIDSSTPSLSFRVTPKGCRSNEWAWNAMAQQLNPRKHKTLTFCTKATQKVIPVTPSCYFLSVFLKYQTPFLLSLDIIFIEYWWSSLTETEKLNSLKITMKMVCVMVETLGSLWSLMGIKKIKICCLM